MRPRHVSSLALAALLAAFAVPALAGSAFDLYRVPDHRTRHLDATAGGRLGRTGQNALGSSSLRGLSYGSLQGGADWLHDTDTRQWSLDAAVSFTGERRNEASTVDPPGMHGEGHTLTRLTGETVSLDAAWREYPTALPLALEIAAQGTVVRSQVWEHSTGESESFAGGVSIGRYESADGRWRRECQEEASGMIALGWGRARDASAVHTAWVLEQRGLA